MSIAPLKRVVIAAPLGDKSELLRKLQRFGGLHITPLSADTDSSPDAPLTVKRARLAIRFLQDTPSRRHQILHAEDFDVYAFIETVLALKDRWLETNNRIDFLEKRIDTVEDWGELHLHRDNIPGGERLWFYELPLRHKRA